MKPVKTENSSPVDILYLFSLSDVVDKYKNSLDEEIETYRLF